ncbi:MAG: peptide ABC transporter ATP-binding protein [Candidatus Rokubacteria bacterium 13_2_20CM_69_10]|nr:MAG: peptide ABC transporter ATP-binding protein [Candidatus Rokubacteria bacterium 13_2_20CM_69_10]
MAPLLSVESLRTQFATSAGVVRAVDGLSFAIDRGEVLGLVGESGCGKSVTSLSIMRLVPPPGAIVGGRIRLDGDDLLDKDAEAMRRVRGARIGMVFQEPMTSLNPVFTIGDQIAAAVLAHAGGSRRAAWECAVEMLDHVQVPSPRERSRDYPHQLSGGLRQRAMIALALAPGPQLLIADEPTTALDVTIQAQILDLLRRLQAERGMAVLLITHDLGVVAELCHRVAIIYAGRIVEMAPVASIFSEPLHPYTRGLLRCLPHPSRFGQPLSSIDGAPPDLRQANGGCRFAPRCPLVQERCRHDEPALAERKPGHVVACPVVTV